MKLLQGPVVPLPTPFPIPTPDPSVPGVGDALWDVDNLGGALSAFQTVFVFAEQYKIISVFAVAGMVALVVWVMASIVSGRASNI